MGVGLQETTFLQQTGHLLIFPFSRFPLQTEVPELVTIVHTIDVLVEGILEEREDGADAGEAKGHGLPTLDILDDLGCLLAFSEVYHLTRKFIFRTIVNEGKGSEVDTYNASRIMSR